MPAMIHLGLIGYPLGHSLSPTLHTAALRSCGLEGDYSLFPIYPEEQGELQSLLARVRNGEITGLNVTIPHKQNVIPILDELTPTAASIGAVNTIYFRDRKLVGDNTDAPGFLADLNGFLSTKAQRHGNSYALVLGAGGSARAIVCSLLQDGWDVTIAARRFEQAEVLSSFFREHKLRIVHADFSNLGLSDISLVVNTTPVGMTPNIDQSPWPRSLPFPTYAAIYDLVYNPRETKLVRDARRQGLRATTGLGMLVEQAALSFEIWTNQNPSRRLMRASIEQSPVTSHQVPITNHGAL
jgi:shikimate dehydrogenase